MFARVVAPFEAKHLSYEASFPPSLFLSLSFSTRKSRLITCGAQKEEPTPPHDRPGNPPRRPRRCFTRLVSFGRYNVDAPAGSSSFSFLEACVFLGRPHQSTHRRGTRATATTILALSNCDQVDRRLCHVAEIVPRRRSAAD